MGSGWGSFVEILYWLPVGIIPIFNGMIRIFFYQKILGEPYSSFVSSSFDIILIFAYALFVQIRKPGRPDLRGFIWALLSTLTHFSLGLLLFGMSFDQLVAKYQLWKGETWLLITLFIFAAPRGAEIFEQVGPRK